MSSQSDAPSWRSTDDTPPVDPFAGARSEVWSPTEHRQHDQSPSILDTLTKPESIIGEALTVGGIASRFLLKVPFASKMSWGITAAGLALTAFSIMEHNKEKT
ncbi:hypothetical protein BH10CYA1_BH10CYA1_00860 [soil metagenome]